DFLKMPECIMNTTKVRMDERERKQYETLKEELLLRVPRGTAPAPQGTVPAGALIDAKNAAALCGKLCQLANGACYTEDGTVARIHDRKLDALEDLIESANGHPVLIAYWYQHDIQRIRQRFPDVRILRNSQDLADWNKGKIQMAAIHPASAGHGLNLQQGGNTLIWFGLTWSLELYLQTNSRLWRQGQKSETVTIHHIVTEGTIDEQILEALGRKDRTQESLIAAVKAQID
ncbi:MAG: DEAD/DEAH box helicase, partial [Clostridia bacterium]